MMTMVTALLLNIFMSSDRQGSRLIGVLIFYFGHPILTENECGSRLVAMVGSVGVCIPLCL